MNSVQQVQAQSPSHTFVGGPTSMTVPPNGSFEDAVQQGNYPFVEYMLENGFLQEEWALYHAIETGDKKMIQILMEHQVFPEDSDVDHCVRNHDLETAIMFTDRFHCGPTEDAFELLFEKMDSTNTYECVRILEWLYYIEGVDMRCSVARYVFSRKERDPVIVKWFADRVE